MTCRALRAGEMNQPVHVVEGAAPAPGRPAMAATEKMLQTTLEAADARIARLPSRHDDATPAADRRRRPPDHDGGRLPPPRRLRGRRRRLAGRRPRAARSRTPTTRCVLDLMLPDGDGLDLWRELRADAAHAPPAAADAHRARRADGPHRRPRDRRRRLPAQAVRAARAAGARQGAAAPRRAASRRTTRCCASAGSRSTSARARRAWTASPATSPATSSTCWWCWRRAPAACCRATRSWTR